MLNIVRLASVSLNVIGNNIKKVIRYVPDNEVPDTHIQFSDADGLFLVGADDNMFYCKNE